MQSQRISAAVTIASGGARPTPGAVRQHRLVGPGASVAGQRSPLFTAKRCLLGEGTIALKAPADRSGLADDFEVTLSDAFRCLCYRRLALYLLTIMSVFFIYVSKFVVADCPARWRKIFGHAFTYRKETLFGRTLANSSMSLIVIFNVKYSEIHYFYANLQDFAYNHGPVVYACLSGVPVCMCVCLCVCLCRTSAKIKNLKNDVCRFWHMPSIAVSAKIVLRDLDLNFQGHAFEVAIMKVNAGKMQSYYCHQIGSQVCSIEWRHRQSCRSLLWFLFWRSRMFTCKISRQRRELAKKAQNDFYKGWYLP